MFVQQDLFVAGQDGVHTYRIPALAVSPRGTLLAFCEARKHSRSDTGEIAIALRRSTDGGETWSEAQIIASMGGDTLGNPCPVVDRDTGVIWLPLCWNRADRPESEILAGRAPRGVWLSKSEDDGLTWSPPSEITAQVKRPEWTWYATGPGHGIQLRSGRLLVPCDHAVRGDEALGPERYYAHAIYSDDHGAGWHIGGTLGPRVNECAAAESEGGTLYLNLRSYHGTNRRAFATSRDGGLTWSEPALDVALIEPVCQAGLVSLGGERLAFTNPASTRRERLTVRLSEDGGRSWTAARVLHAGPCAYSDLALLPGGTIGCLYERGEQGPYERITWARFPEGWVRG